MHAPVEEYYETPGSEQKFKGLAKRTRVEAKFPHPYHPELTVVCKYLAVIIKLDT